MRGWAQLCLQTSLNRRDPLWVLQPAHQAVREMIKEVGVLTSAENAWIVISNGVPAGGFGRGVVVRDGSYIGWSCGLDDVQALLPDVLAGGSVGARVRCRVEERKLVGDPHVVADVLSRWGFPAVHGDGDKRVGIVEVHEGCNLLPAVVVQLVQKSAHHHFPAGGRVVEALLNTA